MSEWQPIKTAPKSERILLASPNGAITIGAWLNLGDKAEWFDCVDGEFMHATHWMPLPEPPGESG